MAAFAEAELVDFLNRMLEAERAGARALVVFMDDWPRNGAEWKTLRRIHEDEAHNCALIGGELKRRGRDYSHATGDFFQKATSIQDKKERIAFLIKGLKWAIRKFERASPKIEDAAVRKLFDGMRERHVRSAAACESVAQK